MLAGDDFCDETAVSPYVLAAMSGEGVRTVAASLSTVRVGGVVLGAGHVSCVVSVEKAIKECGW